MEQYFHDIVMDLAWRRSLSDRYVIHVRSKNQPSDSDHTPKPKYLGSGPAGIKYYWEGSRTNRSSLANHSALYADNDFLTKSRVLTDMLSHPVRHHSFTTVLVIASIFLFFTVTITIAVIVFCRKRNSVFALQKSEQEDEEGEYELDELNTDVEYTETDVESEYDNISRRKSYPLDASEDPTHRLLGAAPVLARQRPRDPFRGTAKCHCQHGLDNRGAYQTMVVAAVLERRATSDSENDEARPDAERVYTQCSGDTDADSDHELLYSAHCHLVSHSGSCPCDDNSYSCVYCQSANTNHNNNNICSSGTAYVPVSSCVHHRTGNIILQSSLVEGAYDNLRTISNKCQHCTADCRPSFLYVALPPDIDKLRSNKGTQYYVRLPPKNHDNSNDDNNSVRENDADDENDYDIGVNYNDVSSNSGSCVIDLHPEHVIRRPTSLRLSSSNSACFNADDEVCDWSGIGELRMSRASVRSKSVTDNLSAYANYPASPDYSLQSCPETPLMEQQSGSAAAWASGYDLSRSSGSLPYHYSTNKHTVTSVKYSDSMLYNETQHINHASSAAGADQHPGASFVLASPYSSLVSLTRAPISETASQPLSQSYALPAANSAASDGQPPDCRKSQTIIVGMHHEDSPHPSSQLYSAGENGELSPNAGTSSNRNPIGTSRDNCGDVIGREDTSDSNDEENEETRLNGSSL